jgi:glycosyltransferase involved in cell wall biosynthesis
MIKSGVKNLYDLLTSGPLKKACKDFTTKYPRFEPFVRQIQLQLFDRYLTKPRIVQFRAKPTPKIVFVDVSCLVLEDLKTGIQRVTRSILLQLLSSPPAGYEIQAVYGDRHVGYKAGQIGHGANGSLTISRSSKPQAIEVSSGDIFLGLDFACITTLKERNYLSMLRAAGVKVYFVVYDLLPVQFPTYFPSSAKDFHERWLRTLLNFDGAICISKAVADDYQAWITANRLTVSDTFKATFFHLGADLNNSAPSKGLPPDAEKMLGSIRQRPTFLMVGTLEPRKGYRQILDAFTLLWQANENINLLIVGKIGWNIAEVAGIIAKHPELNKKLFWLKGISDEYLEKIYTASACLIAASEGEGFGLPLIESAQYGIPLMLRDIPVFREVAGDSAFYFGGPPERQTAAQAAQDTAESIKTWLNLSRTKQHPLSTGLKYNTWQQSVEQLQKSLFMQ